jgi:hypothetical protein
MDYYIFPCLACLIIGALGGFAAGGNGAQGARLMTAILKRIFLHLKHRRFNRLMIDRARILGELDAMSSFPDEHVDIRDRWGQIKAIDEQIRQLLERA